MESTPYILGLPAEVLQSIARFVDGTDLPTLRLVSKEVGYATFDIFARRYLSSLRCYVMDPARLQRLKSITSLEYLARKIRKVTLCLDPYEFKRVDDIMLAPKRNTKYFDCWGRHCVKEYHLRGAQIAAQASYIRDQYNLHNRQNPDVALIVSILWDLKAVHCPDVVLDLYQCNDQDGNPSGVPREYVEKSDAITHPILNAFFSSGCALSGLKLEGDDFLYPEFLGVTQVDTVESLGRRLQSYRLIPYAKHLARGFSDAIHNGPSPVDRWRTLTTGLLASAERLQDLYLEVGWDRESGRGCESVLYFTSVMLQANQLSFLRRLTLVQTDCHPSCFLKALGRCSDSLERLILKDILFASPGLHWPTLFEHFLECPRLEVLGFDSLIEESDRGTGQKRHQCRMRNPLPGSISEPWQLTVKGSLQVKKVLVYNIKYFKDETPSPSPSPLSQ